MKSVRSILIAFTSLSLGASPMLAQSGHDLFQQALIQERTHGNLEEAIQLYERVIVEFTENRTLVADALVRLGSAYEKLGRAGARAAYQRVVSEFGDQREQARFARARLSVLSSPAARRRGGPGGIGPTYTFVRDRLQIGMVGYAAQYDFSPDGREVVFRDHVPGERPPGLYISSRDGSAVRSLIVLDSAGGPVAGPWSPRWSPEGSRIAFLARFPNRDRVMGLYVIGVDGEGIERVGDSFEGDLSWLPNGSGITYVGDTDRRLHTWLVAGQRRDVALGDPLPQTTLLGGYSPDGEWFAVDIRTARLGREMRDIWVMAADGSRRFHVTDSPGLDANPAWGPDGRLYFVSDRNGSLNIWRLRVDATAAQRRLPNRLGPGRSGRAPDFPRGDSRVRTPEQVTFFDDARLTDLRTLGSGGIAFVLQSVTNTIRIARVENPVEFRPVLPGIGPQLSPDGSHVVFGGEDKGRDEVFLASTDGGRPIRLIADVTPSATWRSQFRLSPDGAAVAYLAETQDGRGIFVAPTTGGPSRLITSIVDDEMTFPVWSPGGTEIAFASGGALFIVPPHAGVPTKLANLDRFDASSVRWSPDGRYLSALGWRDGARGTQNHAYVVPASGGSMMQVTPERERQEKHGLEWHPTGAELTYGYATGGFRTAYLDGRPTTTFFAEPDMFESAGVWAPDGSAFYFVASRDDRPGWQLYRREVGTGAITEAISGDDISLPSWSRDGSTMALSVRQVVSQLWVMQDFR